MMMQKQLAKDVMENEEKINHHGKRADAIVKGMLQHSRTSSGQKEPTDINALCDEYLRLAYHGMRAKDKSFNADIKTDFDETHCKNKYHSAGYWKSLVEFIQQCFLRSKPTCFGRLGRTKLSTNCFCVHKEISK